MLIAIPTMDDRGLESEVSMHFGRAPFFTFVEVEDGEIRDVDVVRVPFEGHGPGDLPSFIREHGGHVVIAYGMGPRAVEFFERLGIKVVLGASGKVGDVVRAYLGGDLRTDKGWREKGDFGDHDHM